MYDALFVGWTSLFLVCKTKVKRGHFDGKIHKHKQLNYLRTFEAYRIELFLIDNYERAGQIRYSICSYFYSRNSTNIWHKFIVY